MIGLLQGLDVLDPQIPVDHQGKQARLEQQEGRDGPNDPTVSILIGMDLSKAMMKPGRNDERIFVVIFGSQLQESIHFGLNVNGRAILVHQSVGPLGVVFLLFVMSLQKGNLQTLPEWVNGPCGVLMVYQNDVQFVNYVCAQWPVARHTVHDKLNRCFLIAEDVDQPGWFDVGTRAGDKLFGKALGHQCFGGASVKVIQTLEYSGFDAESANQGLRELREILLARGL